MAHVALGERVYVKGSDMYGDVNRTTVLGVTAVSLVDDEGVTKAFFGSKMETGVVAKSSGLDGSGAKVDLPVDVRQEGAEVLTALNISPEDQATKFSKFMGMFDQATRRAYMEDWVAKKDDPAQRATFLQGILSDLDDDDLFITTQGNSALAHIDEEVRQKMFQRLLTDLTKEQREGLILEWMAVKHYPDRREEFLQGMYELLMDDDDYIAMEGRKAFTELRILAEEQAAIFTKFMTTVSAEDRATYVADYRKVRTTKSQKKKLLQYLIDLTKT
ncbi:unnamed protein product [Ectocarpus sp. 12 AP-2014]